MAFSSSQGGMTMEAALAQFANPVADAAAARQQRVRNTAALPLPLDAEHLCVNPAHMRLVERDRAQGQGQSADDAQSDVAASQMQMMTSGGGRLQRTTVHSWLCIGVPAALLTPDGGLMSFRRGSGEQGLRATMLHLVVEFVLSAYAYAIEAIDQERLSPVRGDELLHIYLEQVLAEVPDGVPVQEPPTGDNVRRLSPEELRRSLNQHDYARLFTNGNFVGYRLHLVSFDAFLSPPRMLRNRIIRNQVVTGLASEELAAVRIALSMLPPNLSEEERKERVGRVLKDIDERRSNEQPLSGDGDDAADPPAEVSELRIQQALSAAKCPPSDADVQTVLRHAERGAGELYTAVLTNARLELLKHTYLRLCNLGRHPDDISADELPPSPLPAPDEDRFYGCTGRNEATAPWRVFSLENSTRLLAHFASAGQIDARQTNADYYGGQRSGAPRSVPYPHLVVRLPGGIIAPHMLTCYRLPHENTTAFDQACAVYERAIEDSARRERLERQRESAASAGAAHAAASRAAGVSDDHDGDIQSAYAAGMMVRRSAAEAASLNRALAAARGDSAAARATDAESDGFLSMVTCGKDPLHDEQALGALGVSTARFIRGAANAEDEQHVVKFRSGINVLREQHTANMQRVEAIVSRWPARHSEAWRESEAERHQEQERCAGELQQALQSTMARQFEALLLNGSNTLSSTYAHVARALRNSELDASFSPNMMRMVGYSMSSMADVEFNVGLVESLGYTQELRLPRMLLRAVLASTWRPSCFDALNTLIIGPPGQQKSRTGNFAQGQHPGEDKASVAHRSTLSDMAGGAPQTEQLQIREEMDQCLADGRPQAQQRNQDALARMKQVTTASQLGIARLMERDGQYVRTKMEVDRSGAEVQFGNQRRVSGGSDMAVYTRFIIMHLLPEAAGVESLTRRMLSFGQRRQNDREQQFQADRQRLNMLSATICGASNTGVLPSFDMTVPGVIFVAAAEEWSRWIPDFLNESRSHGQYMTLSMLNHMDTRLYQEFKSMVSQYLSWSEAGRQGRVIGVEPFRIDTLHQYWATHMHVTTPAALNALCPIFEQYREMAIWRALYMVAVESCHFDRTVYEPLYRQSGLLPDVQQRANEFSLDGQSGVLPSFIQEYDEIIQGYTMHARELSAKRGDVGMHVVRDTGHQYPAKLLFRGSYAALIQKTSWVLRQYGFEADANLIGSMFDALKTRYVSMPVIQRVDRHAIISPDSLKFDGEVALSGGKRHTLRRITTAVLNPISVRDDRRIIASAGATAGDADSNATDESGNCVEIMTHYLMMMPHHVLYMGMTAACDRATQPCKVMLPLPSWRHARVMHTIEIGPRYIDRPFTLNNPNYVGSSRTDPSRDVDLSPLADVFGKDARTSAQMSASRQGGSSGGLSDQAPVISYRHSFEFDAWVDFLRKNHIKPTPEQLRLVERVNQRIEKDTAGAVEQAVTTAVRESNTLRQRLGLTEEQAARWQHATPQARADLLPAGFSLAKVEAAVNREIVAARHAALAAELRCMPLLVVTYACNPEIAAHWPLMTTDERWALLHPQRHMMAEARLADLQRNNISVSSMFRRPVDEIDACSEYPQAWIDNADGTKRLSHLCQYTYQQRKPLGPGKRSTSANPVDPVAEPELHQRLQTLVCDAHPDVRALSFTEARRLIAYQDPASSWGRLFAACDQECHAFRQERNRVSTMQAMVLDMVAARSLARVAATNQQELHATGANYRRLLERALPDLEPIEDGDPEDVNRLRWAFDMAAVMMLLYFDQRKEEIIQDARRRCIALFNDFTTLGSTNANLVLAQAGHDQFDEQEQTIADQRLHYVLTLLSPVQRYVVETLRNVTVSEDLSIAHQALKSIKAGKRKKAAPEEDDEHHDGEEEQQHRARRKASPIGSDTDGEGEGEAGAAAGDEDNDTDIDRRAMRNLLSATRRAMAASSSSSSSFLDDESSNSGMDLDLPTTTRGASRLYAAAARGNNSSTGLFPSRR